MLNLIIINELNKRLGRESTVAEQRDAILNISDMLEQTDTIGDLLAAFHDYMSDTYVRCDQCGELHRRDEMTDITGPYGCMRVCNKSECEVPAYDEVNYDRQREWATY